MHTGRGRKKKGKGMRRYLYPVMIGLFISKVILFPMLLKVLTIMSSASFVISKMSLLTSVLLGFKWFLTNSNQPMQQRPAESSKVEIVHIPVKDHKDWDRETGDKFGMAAMTDNYDPYHNVHEMKPTAFM